MEGTSLSYFKFHDGSTTVNVGGSVRGSKWSRNYDCRDEYSRNCNN